MSSGEPILNPHDWVEMHADYLHAYAVRRLADMEQVRDLIQETFLAALEGSEKFKGGCSERTWLTAILRNKIIDVYRKKPRSISATNLAPAGWEFLFADDGPDQWDKEDYPEFAGIYDHAPLHHKEFNRVIQSCINQLPALWSVVFTMKYIEDESKAAICAQLNISEANFWVIIHRAKANLRLALRQNWA